jgi:hypothetical protein
VIEVRELEELMQRMNTEDNLQEKSIHRKRAMNTEK